MPCTGMSKYGYHVQIIHIIQYTLYKNTNIDPVFAEINAQALNF